MMKEIWRKFLNFFYLFNMSVAVLCGFVSGIAVGRGDLGWSVLLSVLGVGNLLVGVYRIGKV